MCSRKIKIIIIFIILSSAACRNNELKYNANRTNEIHTIKANISDAIGWARNKDFDLLYSIISNDSNYLEVDPGSNVIKGFSQFRKNEAFWGDPRFKSIGYEIRDLKISVSQSGTVAWYYCVLDDINEWNGKQVSWMNTRWTGVLEKRKEKWIIVQMHFSFAKE
jgi:ketosteroid isomerase-like protein